MSVFINAYVLISVTMYLLHKWLASYEKKHGISGVLQRWHDVVHNVGHMLRIALVLLVYYLIYKSVSQASPSSLA